MIWKTAVKLWYRKLNVMKFYTIRRGLCFLKKFKNEKENEYGNELYKN